MYILVEIDGKEYKGKTLTNADASVAVLQDVDDMQHMSLELENGNTLFLPRGTIQRAVFQFIEQN